MHSLLNFLFQYFLIKLNCTLLSSFSFFKHMHQVLFPAVQYFFCHVQIPRGIHKQPLFKYSPDFYLLEDEDLPLCHWDYLGEWPSLHF